MTKSKQLGPSRLETTLALLGIGTIGLSLLSIVITLAGSFFGVTSNLEIFAQVSLIGLPIGFLLVVAFLMFSIFRKGRETKQ
jgi:hypothetical protein